MGFRCRVSVPQYLESRVWTKVILKSLGNLDKDVRQHMCRCDGLRLTSTHNIHHLYSQPTWRTHLAKKRQSIPTIEPMLEPKLLYSP